MRYDASAVDAVDGQINPACVPQSGSKFSVGTTTVACTARDSANSTSSPTFAVTVHAAPRLSAFALTPRSFRPARSGPSLLTQGKVGAKVSYKLSAPAAVVFTVERVLTGRRQGKSCLPDTRARRRLPRCTRYVPLKGAFKQVGHKGANGFRFSGRLSNRTLTPGATGCRHPHRKRPQRSERHFSNPGLTRFATELIRASMQRATARI